MAKKFELQRGKNAAPTQEAKKMGGSPVAQGVVPLTEPKNIAIDKLQDATYNPRKIAPHDLEELKKSLAKFNAVQPAVVNMFPGREYTIVGGHQRIRAARELGWKDYPCVLVKLSEKDERELNIRLNRNLGEWDFDKLMDPKFFKSKELLDFGFEDFELDGLDDIVQGGNLDADSMFNQTALEEVAERRAAGKGFDRGAANRKEQGGETGGENGEDNGEQGGLDNAEDSSEDGTKRNLVGAGGLGTVATGSNGKPLTKENLVVEKTDPTTKKKVLICNACGRALPHENLVSPRRK